MKKIPTKDSAGNPNGWILPVWNALEQSCLRPEQVYVTAIAPHSRKGPHLHFRRRGMFCCILGEARIRVRRQDMSYEERILDAVADLVVVLPGTPCALYNDGDTEALVLNMPSPAWSAEDPDEWPVEDWVDLI